jgi:hypothetical protein
MQYPLHSFLFINPHSNFNNLEPLLCADIFHGTPDPLFRRKGIYALQWSLENLIEQKNVSVLFGESKGAKIQMKKRK